MEAAEESNELSGLPIMLKVEEAARVLRIGRTLAYERPRCSKPATRQGFLSFGSVSVFVSLDGRWLT